MAGQSAAVISLMKDHFCRSDYPDCARFMVFVAMGIEDVPPDLLPYEVDIAEAIISRHRP